MDGKTLSRDLAKLLAENPDTSGYLDTRGTYWMLWRAAMDMAKRLRYPRAEATITTVASQRDKYKLPADYLGLYMRDSSDNYFVRYYNASTYSNLAMKDEETIFENNNRTDQAVPGGFCITDYREAIASVTGTATADGDKAAGQCVLTDAAAAFTTYVSAGDTVHNTEDGSTGIVLSVTSATAIVTALFDGTGNDWDAGDAYVIVPQRRQQLAFDAPPSTAGHTVTVPYVQRPAPVYSNYGVYPFPLDMTYALVNYAAWLYKYRDSQPDFGDRWYRIFDKDVRLGASTLKTSTSRRIKVVMKVG